MSTFNGLPAHILLVHFIVVLAPLTALLAIAASIWTGVRSRLVWLIAALAVFTLVLTPLTTEAGEWLEKRVPETAAVEQHTEIGDGPVLAGEPALQRQPLAQQPGERLHGLGGRASRPQERGLRHGDASSPRHTLTVVGRCGTRLG